MVSSKFVNFDEYEDTDYENVKPLLPQLESINYVSFDDYVDEEVSAPVKKPIRLDELMAQEKNSGKK